MQLDAQPAPESKWMLWTGWGISILPALMLLMSGVLKLVMPGFKPEGAPDMGWDESLVFRLGFVEIACTAIYLFPRTAVLGAILLTGYLGGAVATHVRIHDHFFFPIIVGMVVWGGLYLRDARLRALVPLR
jgi:hypothetical protein